MDCKCGENGFPDDLPPDRRELAGSPPVQRHGPFLTNQRIPFRSAQVHLSLPHLMTEFNVDSNSEPPNPEQNRL